MNQHCSKILLSAINAAKRRRRDAAAKKASKALTIVADFIFNEYASKCRYDAGTRIDTQPHHDALEIAVTAIQTLQESTECQ